MKQVEPHKPSPKILARITRISAYSFVLVILTFLGLYGGMYLDQITNMTPNFTFLGLIIGVIIGFSGFIREAITERRGQS